MHAIVHAADIQDRDGGVLVMATLFGLYPFLLKLYADGGYQGAGFQDGLRSVLNSVNVQIVKRSDQARRFIVLLDSTFKCDTEVIGEGLDWCPEAEAFSRR